MQPGGRRLAKMGVNLSRGRERKRKENNMDKVVGMTKGGQQISHTNVDLRATPFSFTRLGLGGVVASGLPVPRPQPRTSGIQNQYPVPGGRKVGFSLGLGKMVKIVLIFALVQVVSGKTWGLAVQLWGRSHAGSKKHPPVYTMKL